MIRLIATILLCSACAALALTPAEFTRMVQADLDGKGVDSAQILEVLQVVGIGAEQHDMSLAGVIRSGKLVAVYYDDVRRDSVKAITSEIVLSELQSDLFSSDGVNRFAAQKRFQRGASRLISLGPVSFFGSVGVGWYVKTAEDFYLLSLRGENMPGKMAMKFFPELTDSTGRARLAEAFTKKPAAENK
ncbi:MAG: hypothetical protein ABIJ61_07155 [bacterium]